MFGGTPLPVVRGSAPVPDYSLAISAAPPPDVDGAIAKAAESVRHMSWFEVKEQRGSIVDGKIHQYQVTVTVGFRVE